VIRHCRIMYRDENGEEQAGHNEYHGELHGKPFHDCEVQKIYVLRRDIEPEDCTLQTEEVESVI